MGVETLIIRIIMKRKEKKRTAIWKIHPMHEKGKSEYQRNEKKKYLLTPWNPELRVHMYILHRAYKLRRPGSIRSRCIEKLAFVLLLFKMVFFYSLLFDEVKTKKKKGKTSWICNRKPRGTGWYLRIILCNSSTLQFVLSHMII